MFGSLLRLHAKERRLEGISELQEESMEVRNFFTSFTFSDTPSSAGCSQLLGQARIAASIHGMPHPPEHAILLMSGHHNPYSHPCWT